MKSIADHDETGLDRPCSEHLTRLRRLLFLLLLLTAMAGLGAWSASASAKGKPVVWKAIKEALLRVNDAPPKDWNVYQTGKKRDPLLLQLGNRFLLIQVHDRKLFEIDPSRIEHKGEDLAWDPSDRPAEALRASVLGETDVGSASRVEARLDAATLVLEFPHPPDVGALPARSQSPTQQRRGRR